MTSLPSNVEAAPSHIPASIPQSGVADGFVRSEDGTIAASVRIDVVIESVEALVRLAQAKYARANFHRPFAEVTAEFAEMYGTSENPDIVGMTRLLYDDGVSMPGVSVQDSHATVHSSPIPIAA